jgi:superkiller protein 3
MEQDPKARHAENRRMIGAAVAVGIVVLIGTVLGGSFVFDVVQARICTSANNWEAVAPCESVAEHGWLRRDQKLKVWRQLTDGYWYEDKLAQGISFYDRMIDAQPGENPLLVERGKLLSWNKEYDKAIADLKKALDKDPAYQDAAIHLSAAFYEKGEIEKAIKVLSQSAVLTVPSSDLYRRMASYHRGSNRLEIGAHFSKLAIEKDENNALAYNELALIMDKQGQRDAALVQVEKAIAIEGTNTTFLDNRALILIDEERYADAEQAYERLLEIDSSAYFRTQLASTLMNQKKHGDAEKILELANKELPSTVSILVELGRLYVITEDYKKARPPIDEALKLEPQNFDARYWLASVEDGEGNELLAIEGYQKLINEAPDAAYLHRDKGISLMDLSRFDEARASINRALDVDGKNWRNWEARALLNIRTKNWQAAVDDAGKAIDIRKNEAMPYARRAFAHWWLENYALAEADYESSLRLNPDTAWVRVEFADFLISDNKLDRAEAQLKILFEGKDPPTGAFKQRGRLAEFRNDPEAALRDYQVAVSKEPDNGWYREDMAWARLMTGDAKDALAQCQEMRRILPEAPEGHRCLANVHWRIDDLVEARKELESALAKDKAFLAAVLDLAKLDYQQLRYAEALERLTLLVNKKHQLARALYWRGRVVADMGNSEPALRDFEEALKHADSALARDIAFDIQRTKNRLPLQKSQRNDLYPQRQ